MTDGRTDQPTYGPTDVRTDGRTDRQTDRRTDTPSYRDARTHLKTEDNLNVGSSRPWKQGGDICSRSFWQKLRNPIMRRYPWGYFRAFAIFSLSVGFLCHFLFRCTFLCLPPHVTGYMRMSLTPSLSVSLSVCLTVSLSLCLSASFSLLV